MDWTKASTTDLINAEYDWRLTADEKAEAKAESARRSVANSSSNRLYLAHHGTPEARRVTLTRTGRGSSRGFQAESSRPTSPSPSVDAYYARREVETESRELGNPTPPMRDGEYDW